LTGEACSGILACFHEAEGLDILCHLMVELTGLKLDSGRVEGMGIIFRLTEGNVCLGVVHSCQQDWWAGHSDN